MFDFSEEAFDQVAVAVEERAEGKALFAIALERDVGEAALRLDLVADGVAVIGLVGEKDAAFRYGVEQRIGFLPIARLALGEMQLDRQPPAIDQRVDLGRQAVSMGTEVSADVGT